MINEVLQWFALAVFGVLILGVLRQIAIWQPLPARVNTSSGPRVGDHVPKEVFAEIQRVLPTSAAADEIILAFVLENCEGCHRLLVELSAEGPDQLPGLVLIARDPTPQFQQALGELSIPAIHDTGRLWNACQVTNTPLVVKLDKQGGVISKGVTHHVETVALTAS